jgi:hypothetical protein
MRNRWDLEKARNYLQNAGLEVGIIGGNVVFGEETNGLTACSAIDYLQKQHGFLIFLTGRRSDR